MVGISFNGRLGNQLFQYCFYLYLKSKNRHLNFFFPNPHHAYLEKYFELENEDNLLIGSKIYSIVGRVFPKLISFRQVYVQNFFAPKEHTPMDFTMYNGFFQSDFYYNQLATPPLLNIKENYKADFKTKFGAIFEHNKTVVVHIRRTDYLTYGKRDISLPVEYFQRQLNSIENSQEYKIIFVSDDMEFVKSAFPAQSNYIYSTNSEIIDFQIIQHADIAIISNSTFAWWATFLSPKQNHVIAPKNWFGFRIGREHPKGIMTSRFDWRDVLE
jgi:hypothetical protein